MKKLVLAITALLVLLPLSAHAETPDITHKVDAGTTYTWDGSSALGTNLLYWGDPATGSNATGTCGDDRDNYCDTVLLEFSNPLTQAEINAGKTKKTKTATITINNFGPVPDPLTDFDLIIFDSDAQGTKGDSLVQSADFGPNQAGDEQVSTSIQTTITQPSKYVLVEIVYFISANSSYKGTAQF
jgi:hypothetical protein